MAKQTQLTALLKELERSTRTHEFTRTAPTIGDEQIRTFGDFDRAEKRVFSFFDALNAELESQRRIATERLTALSAAMNERDMLKRKLDSYVFAPQQAPAPVERFDEAKARAGEPIQYKPLYSGDWADCKFIGMRSTGDVVVEIGPNMFVHPAEFVRMKPRTQTVRMFANVFKDEHGARAGVLYGDADVARKFVGTVAPSVTCVGAAVPVTITVAE